MKSMDNMSKDRKAVGLKGKDVEITKAATLEGLKTAPPQAVWKGTEQEPHFNIWAPEMHQINGT
ncbi:MAG: hypothetical protein Q9227_006947 [Pyrenula ochraceoflavens]